MSNAMYTCRSCGGKNSPGVFFATENECMKCVETRARIAQAAQLELAARWYERIGQRVPGEFQEFFKLGD